VVDEARQVTDGHTGMCGPGVYNIVDRRPRDRRNQKRDEPLVCLVGDGLIEQSSWIKTDTMASIWVHPSGSCMCCIQTHP
jgi:predicted amino acid dehydrogenase